MAIKKIYLDAGHGGSDPGACGNGLKEADLAIKVVKYMYNYLNNYYVCSVYKDLSSEDSLVTICNRANGWGADLFISIHFNAGGGNGFEVLIYSSNNRKLGEIFEKHAESVGQNSRGVKLRPDLGVLRLTTMPAVLNEIAFIDNKKDIKDWDENSELKEMAEALAKAAAEYLKLPLKKDALVDCPDFKVRIISNTLKVRQSPSSTGKQLGTYKKDTICNIVKITADGKWGLLKKGPVSGSSYINLSTKYVKKL